MESDDKPSRGKRSSSRRTKKVATYDDGSATDSDERLENASTVSNDSESSKKQYVSRRDMDICCGRGKGYFGHPGNKVFQESVRDNLYLYNDAESKSAKSAVVADIVKDLYDKGVRFIKKDVDAGGKWYVLSKSTAHEKTGHAIRDHLMQKRRQELADASRRKTKPVSQKPLPKKKSTVVKSRRGHQSKKESRRATKHEDEVAPLSTDVFTEHEIVSLTSDSEAALEYDLFDDLTGDEVLPLVAESSALPKKLAPAPRVHRMVSVESSPVKPQCPPHWQQAVQREQQFEHTRKEIDARIVGGLLPGISFSDLEPNKVLPSSMPSIPNLSRSLFMGAPSAEPHSYEGQFGGHQMGHCQTQPVLGASLLPADWL